MKSFTLDLTVWDGVSIDEAEKRLFDEVEKIKATNPEKYELDRAISQIRAQYAYTLDGVTRQGFVIGIFEMITSFETLASLVQKLEQVTPEQISAVARKYLTLKNRTVCRSVGIRRES